MVITLARQIKFRAWDISHKRFINDVQDAYDGRDSSQPFDCFGDALSDNNFIVEQFTGLKDVNGKDIYEGDIIITHPKYDGEESKSGIVQYGICRAAFSYEVRNGDHRSIWSSNEYRTYEVIGNAHANPELLEQVN